MKDDVPKIMLANFWSLYKAAGFNIARSALLTKHYPGEQIKNNEMGGTWGRSE